jgi:hypothetical protein
MRKIIFRFILILFFIVISFIFSNVSFAENMDIPQNIKDIIIESVEDTTWITASSKDTLTKLQKLYTKDLVDNIWPEIKVFKEQFTDWHLEYKVIDFLMYSNNDKNSLVKVKIQESDILNKEEVYLYGVFRIIKLNNDWKIKSYYYTYHNSQLIDSNCSL